MINRFTLFLLSFLLIISLKVDAQSFYAMKQQRDFSLFVGSGTSSYFGELANPGDYLGTSPNLVLGIQYKLLPRINLRSEVTWFMLHGSDEKADSEGREMRNLSFYSHNVELNVLGVFYLFPMEKRYINRPNINPYLFTGIGFCWFNPMTEYQGQNYALRPLTTEGVAYSTVTPVIPIGLGVSFKVSRFLNIAVEGGFRFTFTDYLDDVSTRHLAPETYANMANPELSLALGDRRYELIATGNYPDLTPAREGSIRGNPDTNDAYFLMNVKLEYYLPPFALRGTRKSVFKR